MLIPFNNENKVLNEKPFINYDVQFNLLYRIIEGKELLALKTGKNDVVAVHNPGHEMWIWVDNEISEKRFQDFNEHLAYILNGNDICGISGDPKFILKIADCYKEKFDIDYNRYMSMGAYSCNTVISKKDIEGKIIEATLKHDYIVGEFIAGFKESENKSKMDKDERLLEARNLIKYDNLFLWEVGNEIVAMANIVHKTPKHARISCVYTKKNRRNKGYATALVSEVSLKILKEGLTPMLYVNLENDTAVKVYENIGYKKKGEIDSIMFIY